MLKALPRVYLVSRKLPIVSIHPEANGLSHLPLKDIYKSRDFTLPWLFSTDTAENAAMWLLTCFTAKSAHFKNSSSTDHFLA